MKNFYLILIFGSLLFTGCVNFTTRTEKDVYTITVLDTTNLYEQKNAPGNRDNGIVFPSSRTITSNRVLMLKDSIVVRDYPDFIRMGLFESVGIIGGNKDSALGTGIFGLFPELGDVSIDSRGKKALFTGGIYRVFVGEWRLRWFNDAKNWTIGTSAWEQIVPDAAFETQLGSILPIYLRKRWFISDKIPYITVTAASGLGWYPSQYLNSSLSLDFGSIGGLNLRAYGGFVAGVNAAGNFFTRSSPNQLESQTVILPYFGLGMSFLDFHNKVEETYIEWKDHEHSAWNVGFAQFGLLYSTADSAISEGGAETALYKGVMIRLLNASLALPFANNQFFVGVSLANLMVMGLNSWGLAILPVRVGYWLPLMPDLSLEPFFELGVYPTKYFHVGSRLNLALTDILNIGLVLGYVNGSTSSNMGGDLEALYGDPLKLNQAYLGISVGVGDRFFKPSEIRYNK